MQLTVDGPTYVMITAALEAFAEKADRDRERALRVGLPAIAPDFERHAAHAREIRADIVDQWKRLGT